MIPISVIIPTHNRGAILGACLDALQHQSGGQEFEIIVVADGCTDNTSHLLRGYDSAVPLSYFENNFARGAAAARNAGAAHANGRILLFLDDDMEASVGLIAAHVDAHRDSSDKVVLGYFPMQPPAPEDGPFTKGARLWWAERFAALSDKGYRFTLKDLCTGNVSLPRSLFGRMGGFDEQIDSRAAGEDYELGYRLIESGARFQFVREAASTHHTTVPMGVSLRRAEQEGLGQSILVRRHPELFWEFNVSRLSRISDRPGLRPLWRAIWAWPGLVALAAAMLRRLVSILASHEVYSLLWRFYGPLRGYYYWKGVRAGFGSLAAWERLAQDAPVENPRNHEIDLDLPGDLRRLDFITSIQRVDAVRIWWNGVPAGRIPPWSGAEPLTAEHIRCLLVQRFSGVLLGILTNEFARAGEAEGAPITSLSTAKRASQ